MFKQHLKDLEEIFILLKSHKMKLNPAKCVFGIKARKFLGFMVSKTMIEPNPEKSKA